jgi:hypothetical protein
MPAALDCSNARAESRVRCTRRSSHRLARGVRLLIRDGRSVRLCPGRLRVRCVPLARRVGHPPSIPRAGPACGIDAGVPARPPRSTHWLHTQRWAHSWGSVRA